MDIIVHRFDEISFWHVAGSVLILLWGMVWLFSPERKLPKGLPPGSFGWPLIGQSFEFLRWRRRLGTFALFEEKRRRYGSNVFKTSIFRSPTVIITGPESHRLLQNDGYRTLTATNTTSMKDLFGESLMLADGEKHKQMRKVIMAALQSKILKTHIKRLEELSQRIMSGWDGKVVSASADFEKFTFYSVLGLLLSMKESERAEELRRYFGIYAKDGISLPLNLPGTPYYRALQARKKLAEELKNIIEERRKERNSTLHEDVLANFMNSPELHLSDREIIDNLLFFIFAGYETTSTTLSRITQLLAEHPHELDKVREEQRKIKAELEDGASLTWEKIKNMPYTSMVINETLRLSHLGTEVSIRTTKTDVFFEGYTIPKGWNIMVDKASMDNNPEIFKDPLKFNPSRFKENIPAYCFMPFGGGVRSCPGMEFATLEISIFIHHFVNNYSWQLANTKEGLEYSGLVAKTKYGVPIYVERLHHQHQ